MSERAYWVAWAQAHGLGPILLKRLCSHFGTLSSAWHADGADLLEVEGIGLGTGAKLVEYRQKISPLELLASYEQQHSNFWTPADAEYPALLYEITDPPPLLFYRGQPELAAALRLVPSVGVVGTRNPSDYGQRWTRRLTQQLVTHNVIVISGLAKGVDRYAHQQTLDSHGLTIAVLGTGVDQVYPLVNRDLHDRIARHGLLLSEHPDGTPPDRAHFPRRNRIIAGLSRAVVVTEAPARSGALITAQLANDYGRDVFAVPGSLDNLNSEGCLGLINQGAQMILNDMTLIAALGQMPQIGSESAGDALTGKGDSRSDPSRNRPTVSPPVLPPLSPVMAQVIAAISDEPISLDGLVQQLAQPTGEVLATLVQLELMGLVTQLPGMRYQRG
ncbi:DNA-processing protein DprA [Phormidium tenue]|uniref:DNA protecting protein DprA n=1 Tax=Phormidium tenue NIES-30 TaxID=549789 RepID=A0A1U7JA23_9CYAN|nr:DNA-processing protein DprA [Phormidium tenue]MBD2230667.1 DNA-protecting protein DprA [Phormidium tenue FACHB-1052]OKH50576.1 DNA protecting protein DprA [Phormidium tenue NIES-30]